MGCAPSKTIEQSKFNRPEMSASPYRGHPAMNYSRPLSRHPAASYPRGKATYPIISTTETRSHHKFNQQYAAAGQNSQGRFPVRPSQGNYDQARHTPSMPTPAPQAHLSRQSRTRTNGRVVPLVNRTRDLDPRYSGTPKRYVTRLYKTYNKANLTGHRKPVASWNQQSQAGNQRQYSTSRRGQRPPPINTNVTYAKLIF